MNRFCYISHSCRCADVNSRITSNQALVTTSIDIAYDSDRVRNSPPRISPAGKSAFRHVDVHLGVAIHIGLEATAKDIVDAGSRLHINRDFATSINLCTISPRTGIGSLVTTTQQVLNNQGFCTILRLFNIDSNITADASCSVISSKHILKDTGSNRNIHIMCNMCIIGASKDIFNICSSFCTARKNDINLIHVRLFTSTVHSSNNQWTTKISICLINNRITTEALGVTATKYLTDFTALRFDDGLSDHDSTIIGRPYAISLNQVATISTAKRSTDIKCTMDHNFRTWYNG